MFSLVKFHNEEFSVVPSKKVQRKEGLMCTVKYNGGTYCAFLVAENDDKSYLQDLKKANKMAIKFPHEPKSIKSAENCNNISPCPFLPAPKTGSQAQHSDNVPIIESNIILSLPKKYSLRNCKKTNMPALQNNPFSTSDSGQSSVVDKNKHGLLFENNLPYEKMAKSEPVKSVAVFKILAPTQQLTVAGKTSLIESNKNLPISFSRPLSTSDSSQHLLSVAGKAELALSFKNHSSSDMKSLNEDSKYTTENNPSMFSESSQLLSSVAGSSIILYEEAIPDNNFPNKSMKNNHPPLFSECDKLYNLYGKALPNTKDSIRSICGQTRTETLDSTINYSPYIDRENTGSTELMPPDLTIPTTYTKLNEISLIHTNFNFVKPLRTKQRSFSLDCYAGDQTHIFNNADKQRSPNEVVRCSRNTNSTIQLQFSQNEYAKETGTVEIQTANIHNSSSVSEVPQSMTSLADLSSVNMEESRISEYIPDSSANISDVKNLQNNTSVDIIDVPLNITKVIVPHSKSLSKKHFCIFCKTLQCKISRHIFLKHKKEIEVKKALLLPVKSKERLRIIADLRKRGDFLHNTSVDHNSGILIVPRRQQSKFKNSVDDYICCKKCKGFFSKKTLRLHVSKCTSSKNNHSNFVDGRRLTQFIHPVANDVLKCKVFPTLRNDYITKAIRYDELVIKFGNKLTEKYSAQHQHDMIRANLRLLGRFKIHLKKLKPDITELKDIFKPYMFDKCIQAVRTTANWEDAIMGFKTPAVAQNITSLIKKCAKKQRAEFIKENNEDLKAQLENFLLLWEEETPTLINKKALEDQTNIKRDKKVFMPTKDDIKKLYLYLKDLIIKAMENLMNGFCLSTWTELVQLTLCLIQIFNRRRAGEIERITVDNFRNKEAITDTIDADILKTLSKESIKCAKQFVRISLRGKLGRTVSVLLCPMTNKAVELILKYRSDAGITEQNNFVFSKPTTSKLAKQYFRACPLLKRFAEECGAQIPESLRGTNLRKHIATYTALLNAEEAAVDKLANFMGHHKDIHKNIYRVSVPAAEITCISKLLIGAIGDEEELDDENVTDEDVEENGFELNITKSVFQQNEVSTSLEIGNSADSLEENSKNTASSSRKRRSTSPFGKTKRIRWTNDEKAAIFTAFGDIKALKYLPTLSQCLKVISEQTALKGRTPQQIKSWIDNQRRYK